MKYAVDSIVDEIAVLENIETGEKKQVNLSLLPDNVQESNIVIESETYILDKQAEEERRETLEEKLERLKHLREEDTEE